VEQQIGFCGGADGARIAYATVGEGPALVIPAHWLSNVQQSWQFPEIRCFFEELARHHTLVRYDQRGTGLSDRNRTDFTLESELKDLETVIDRLKLKRLALFGFSIGGPIAVAYIARHPHRVSRLILYNTFARGKAMGSEELHAALVSLIRAHWGISSKTFADMFYPGASPTLTDHYAEFQRECATQEMAAQLLDLIFNADIEHLLTGIRAPTLVLHRQQDRATPFRMGRELASLIPNARFVPLEGNIHFPWAGDSASVLRNIAEFLGDPVTDIQAVGAAQPVAKQTYHDVFISFAFPDKDAAGKIYTYFKRNGIDPFWCEELAAGDDYPQLLGEAIRNSKAFLVVISNASDNSASVRKETTIAHNNKKSIIPVRIEDILPKNLEYLVASSLFFDAFPQPIEQYLPKLAGGIKKIIGSKAEKKTGLKK
jgi:pimeloyl-ACP methyl ester carboxylesterase